MASLIGQARPLPPAGGPGGRDRVIQRLVVPAFGQNSRQSAAQEAWSFTRCTLTPTWQLPTWRSVPEYCRATQAEALPSFGKPTSSTTSASTGQPTANHHGLYRTSGGLLRSTRHALIVTTPS